MNYFIARAKTTVGTLKRSIRDDDQQIFPLVNSDQVYQGLIYAKDLAGCDDNDTAWDVFAEAKKSGEDRNIFVLTTQPSTEAKEILHIRDLQFVPVVDRKHRIVGTVDESS